MEMTVRQAIEIVIRVLETMRNGDIRILVRNGQITHINRTDEVFPEDRKM